MQDALHPDRAKSLTRRINPRRPRQARTIRLAAEPTTTRIRRQTDPQPSSDGHPTTDQLKSARENPEFAKADLDRAAWYWFLDMNSPLTGTAPKHWESFKQTSLVFLPNGATPGAYTENPVPQAVLDAAEREGLNTSLPFHNLDSTVQVDGLALKINREALPSAKEQLVRYQLLMNEGAFDYIVQNSLYNVNGQEALAKSGGAASFPSTSWELKTSWIWIGTDAATRETLAPTYYIVNAFFDAAEEDAETPHYVVGQAALTGMHIINKLQPNWYWATFENVNNANFTRSTIELEIPDSAKEQNAFFQHRLKAAGSIFANYELVGVQWELTDATGKATLLANSQIESDFQPGIHI